MSLLSWERGLKLCKTGAPVKNSTVAPLVGAWIEIYNHKKHNAVLLSLLSWERGLKFTGL